MKIVARYNSFASDNDVRRYLEDEFSRVFTERWILPLPSATETDHLVFKSSGQFVYSSTVIKFVGDEDCNPREQLGIILKLRTAHSSSPFAQLVLLYQQTLSQQPNTRLFEGCICTGNWSWSSEHSFHL
ncbi:hypothetical protein AX14_004392 [Amanita brunnescens Koide BX004]|nr:hypothetical protein AX14_004392 [Amanita brunnescens Koide BX004]